MDQQTETPPPANELPKDSVWKHLFHSWILHYLLPGLIGLVVLIFKVSAQQQAEQDKLQKDFNSMRQAVREGKASPAANMLFKEDYNEFLKQKKQP